MATYQLNIIFHGPFIFVIYSDRVEVLSPDVDGHDCGAGTWQEEKPCDPGKYVLKINTKQRSMQGPDNQSHVIIKAKAFPDLKIPTTAYYQFVLPLPSLMTALGLLLPESNILFTGNDVPKINVPTQIGSAHLLCYQLAANDTPQLEKFPWTPEKKNVSTNVYAFNLHIFSESPFDLGALHPNADFDLMMQVLPGLSLKLVQPFPDIEFKLNPNVKNLGVDDEEQGGLRGVPKKHIELVPPRICDTPSLVVDTTPG